MNRILKFIMGVALAAAGVTACQDAGDISFEKPAPRLISIVPSSVWNGCTAIISGTGFSTVAEDNVVTVDGQPVSVTLATENRLTVTMPEHADGKAVVGLSIVGKAVESELEIEYGKLPALEVKVTGIAPIKGYAGDVITVFGENFSENAADNIVTFDGIAAQIQSASKYALKVVAPEHAKGAVAVKVVAAGQTVNAPSNFTYMVFAVTSNVPTAGSNGDEVTLIGDGFSPVADENIVMINGVNALVKSATETSLVVVMPDNPEGKYSFSVTVAGKTVTGGEFAYGGAWRVESVMGAPSGTTADVAGTGSNARLKNAQDIILAPDGSYWITIRGTHGVWKMTNIDETYSYSKIVATEGDDLLKNSYPWGASFDSKGLFYIAAKGGTSMVLTCTSDGVVTQYPVNGITLSNTMKVLVDKSDNLYILVRASANNGVVLKVKDNEILKQWKLTRSVYEMMCFSYDQSKLFVFPHSAGDVQMIDLKTEEMTVVAGTGKPHTSADAYTDGTPGQPLTATIAQTEGAICAADGTIFFTDIQGTVRTFVPDGNGDYTKGTITTIAGQPFNKVVKDGIGTAATFYYPGGICLAADGKTLYMIDGTSNGVVRKIYYR